MTSLQTSDYSRRRFFKRSSLTLAGIVSASQWPLVRNAHAACNTGLEIKIGLIGCGGRGTGATLDALGAATNEIYPRLGYHTEDAVDGAIVEKKGVKVVALADLFEDRLARCAGQLTKVGIRLPKEMCFTGFDAFERLLAVPEINYVILATPPHFRPAHFKAAIEAGKHVFMEKPVAVDVPGVRTVLDAGELARQKGLGVVAGTDRRHTKGYQETIRRVRDGAIGEIIYGRCYWNGLGVWLVERRPEWSDMEWQLRNWMYFSWLSGDHYVEQHVHNLDVMNWAIGAHPVRAASGVGGRQVNTDIRYGNVFDHFAVEFEYPNGVRVFSQARQIANCDSRVEEQVLGTLGASNCRNAITAKTGPNWRFRGPSPNPYRQEHEDLIASIHAGNPINEAKTIAESTMTGILGRESVYSGKAIEWDAAMQSTSRLGPDKYELAPCPMPDVAMPGRYRFR